MPACTDARGGTDIVVIERGWHTDVALPAAAATGRLAELRRAFPGVRFLVFGFGDRAYYLWRGAPFVGMVAAAFPGPGLILVTALRATPAEAFGGGNVITLRVAPAASEAANAFIASTLERGPGGGLVRVADGPYPGSAFYASGLTYDLLDDCNYWTLAVLASAGLPADPHGVVFAGSVMQQGRRIAALLSDTAQAGCAPREASAP